jgi:signal transduction histidine kinase
MSPLNSASHDPPFVEIDEEQIKQVIVNVSRTRRAIPGGGTVRITAGKWRPSAPITCHASRVIISRSAADQGAGIPEGNLPKLFDPYFTTKEFSSQRGRGLGLAICHSIMLKHEGMITATSVVGKGTTFEIYIPAAGPAPDVSGISTVAATTTATKKRVPSWTMMSECARL